MTDGAVNLIVNQALPLLVVLDDRESKLSRSSGVERMRTLFDAAAFAQS